MPTYASTASFDLAIDEIVEEAFERCGLQNRTGYQLKTARRSLNLLLAEWSNRGLNLWTIQKQTAALAADVISLSGTSLYGTGADDASQIVEITDMVIRDSSNNEYSCSPISRATYLNYTVKTSGGRPTQYYFEKTINPTLYLYPAADAAYTVVYYAMLRMKDSGAYTNNNEIPFSFLPCLTAGLAYYLSLKYAPDRSQVLKIAYEEEFKRAADTNRGNVSSHFVPHLNITTGTY
tara:strand:+ start:474 stop:1178 length:705 start_codon:yes stop_codon:yes gene_type:complete